MLVLFSLSSFTSTAQKLLYEDSPFGLHPASIGPLQNQSFREAQDIGIRWHRPPVYSFWMIIQPDLQNKIYDWTINDAQYKVVPEGINILGNIDVEPRLNPGNYSLPNSYLPVDTIAYAEFVRATVERYDGDGNEDMPGLKVPIRYWQIGNEINLKLKDFPKLQRITYQAIKDACSDCSVLIGGVGGMPDNYPGNFISTYMPILQALKGQYIDIFDFHWYGTATGDYRKMGKNLAIIHNGLQANGYGSIPVWITEMGTYSGDPADDPFHKWTFQTEAQQAGDLLKRYIYPLALGIKKIFPAFGLMEGFKHDDGYFDHTGLIYEGDGANDLGRGVKKLAYYTYKLMTEKLEGCDWKAVETVVEDTVSNYYIYKFNKNGNSIFVVWWDYFLDSTYTAGKTREVEITGLKSKNIIITEAVPKYRAGAEVTDYSTAFRKDTLTATDGTAMLTLGENPVFVESFESTEIYESYEKASREIILYNNYPNPVTTTTTFRFLLPNTAKISLKISDILGRTITTIVDAELNPGIHSVVLDTKDLLYGVYFYRLTAGGFSEIKKMIIKR